MTCLALITSTSGLLPRQPIGRPDIDQAREMEALNAAWTDRRDTQSMCSVYYHIHSHCHKLSYTHTYIFMLNTSVAFLDSLLHLL